MRDQILLELADDIERLERKRYTDAPRAIPEGRGGLIRTAALALQVAEALPEPGRWRCANEEAHRLKLERCASRCASCKLFFP